jgi:hypothetical protein
VPRPPTKKAQIIDLYLSQGVHDLTEVASLVGCRPSYVAQTLQAAGLVQGYFDLYTTTRLDQNVYSPFFRNVLSFKNVEAAHRSVAQIDEIYKHFDELGDRAGQHHAMTLALIGQNRARWSGKFDEAAIFHNWLISH